MPTKQTPGQIKYFLKHTIFIGNEAKTHVIAFVSWFLEHPVLKTITGSQLKYGITPQDNRLAQPHLLLVYPQTLKGQLLQ